MKLQSVSADSFATMLLLDKELEPIPEPVRLQPSLTLILSYDEYIQFCKLYLEKNDYLYYRTESIKSWLATDNKEMLLKSFYADVARAVLKELHFASVRGKKATHIAHFIHGAKPLTKEDIENTYKDIQMFAANYVMPYMADRWFPVPQYFADKENQFLWKYAVVLMFYSQVPNCPITTGDF